MATKKAITKQISISRSPRDTYLFFSDFGNFVHSGMIKEVKKIGKDRYEAVSDAGKAVVQCYHDESKMIMDHDFIAGPLIWNVYGRVVPNSDGSEVLYTFIRPDNMSDADFESQLKMYDIELQNLKKFLESQR